MWPFERPNAPTSHIGGSGAVIGYTCFEMNFGESQAVYLRRADGPPARPPLWHRLGPLHVTLETQRCRHGAVAIRELAAPAAHPKDWQRALIRNARYSSYAPSTDLDRNQAMNDYIVDLAVGVGQPCRAASWASCTREVRPSLE
jgi:hypothetical protein